MLQRINHMVSRLIRRVFTSLPINNEGFTPKVQVSYQGGAADTEILMSYGTAYNPPANSLGIMLNNLGNMDDRVAFLYHASTRFKPTGDGAYACGNQLKKTFIEFDGDGNVIIKATADVNVILEGIVNLGEGGNEIARLGDQIQVTIPGGSSAGTYTGNITTAGNNTST